MRKFRGMDVPRLIEELVRIHGSINAAARACGIPEGTMHRLRLQSERSPRVVTLQKLASGFPDKSFLEVIALFVDDGDRARTPAA